MDGDILSVFVQRTRKSIVIADASPGFKGRMLGTKALHPALSTAQSPGRKW